MPQRPRRSGSSPGQPRPGRGSRAARPRASSGSGTGTSGSGGPRAAPRPARSREPFETLAAIPHLAPTSELAGRAVHAAETALDAVFTQKAEPAWALDSYQTAHRRAPWSRLDAWFVDSAIRSLFRWWGWIGPLEGLSTAERLLLAGLLDATHIHPAQRVWARLADREPGTLVALGDAPTWTAKTEGFKRLAGRRVPTVDPWRLFPAWFREAVVLPPGPEPPKVRAVRLFEALQAPASLWVRSQGAEPKAVWDELRALGLKPWVHRKVPSAARLEPELDLESLPAYEQGRLERHDLAAQTIGLACGPVAGQRWWVTHAGSGVEHLHLASLMSGRGVVVATDGPRPPRKRLGLHARRTTFRNVTTREWNGKHVAGKPRSFDGVLVEPPSSAVGTWRSRPEARWLLRPETRARLAPDQRNLLAAAAEGVRPGGFLVYAVPTFTADETTGLIAAFLDDQPEFRLDPFPHPLDPGTVTGQLQLFPSAMESEGWFIAALIRRAGPAANTET
jgi:16S rRNA (cytosine967-C5)-methyltransferase